MGIISWIIISVLAGWIASMFTDNNKSMGAGVNILVGIIGGFILRFLGGIGITGFNIWSLLVSVAGSVILLSVVNVMERQRE
ncbi:MAG: GlsB/YeaQ/YmgE family stress response membrane protein [Hungatella sp.]|nr:GlsB/YeaQ/YmgE family stress response membrane protein [Hungatella sp.]